MGVKDENDVQALVDEMRKGTYKIPLEGLTF